MRIARSGVQCTNHEATTLSLSLEKTVLQTFFIHWNVKSSTGKNRPFSKMAAQNSNKLKLAKFKNVYQH